MFLRPRLATGYSAYELHANFPHVMRLALHLENQQSVVFGDHSDISDILSVEKHSILTGWFVANLKFTSARSLSYLDFPESFVWEKTKRQWKQRLKGHGTTISRVYSAHPGEGERFYLRILLNHVTGCTSFQDIRTLPDGTLCHTFKEAACHRGLLEDDNEYDLCLAMAASWNMPPQLRHLFVSILLLTIPVIRLYFGKNRCIISLMTFFIMLENPCQVSMLMNTF